MTGNYFFIFLFLTSALLTASIDCQRIFKNFMQIGNTVEIAFVNESQKESILINGKLLNIFIKRCSEGYSTVYIFEKIEYGLSTGIIYINQEDILSVNHSSASNDLINWSVPESNDPKFIIKLLNNLPEGQPVELEKNSGEKAQGFFHAIDNNYIWLLVPSVNGTSNIHIFDHCRDLNLGATRIGSK